MREYRLPSHLLSGLINGDLSGLEKEDLDTLQSIKDKFTSLCEEGETFVIEHSFDKEPYFSKYADFTTLGCNVYDIKVYIVPSTYVKQEVGVKEKK